MLNIFEGITFISADLLAVIYGILVFATGITILSRKREIERSREFKSIYADDEEVYTGYSFDQVSDTTYGKIYKKMFSPYLRRNENFIDKLALRLHINLEEVSSDIKKADLDGKMSAPEYVTMKALGFISIAVFGIAYFCSDVIEFLVIGLILFILFVMLPDKRIKDSIKEKKAAISYELPNFFELVKANAEAGLNITDAINAVVEKAPTNPVSKEFAIVNSEAMISGGQWRLAVENMLERNGIDDFTDIMSDILVSVEKGGAIVDILDKDITLLREIKVNAIKERVAKQNTSMMLVMVVFEALPLLVMLMAPVLLNMNDIL